MATAGHCVCMEHSDLTRCEGGKVQYDAGQVIRVFVGLNTQDITVATERHRRLHEKRVEEVQSQVCADVTNTLCVIPSVVIICKAFMTCSTGR